MHSSKCFLTKTPYKNNTAKTIRLTIVAKMNSQYPAIAKKKFSEKKYPKRHRFPNIKHNPNKILPMSEILKFCI